MGKPIMVVGTSSLRRREISKTHFGDTYELVYLSPDIDEKRFRSSDPFELTSMIAHAKMAALREKIAEDTDQQARILQRPGSVAVTFDQVVYYHNEIREKPESKEEAIAFIKSYSNDELGTVMTTVLYSFDKDKLLSMPNTTLTFYREIPDDAIARVVERGQCFHTAGAFVVEDVDMHKSEVKIEPGTKEDVCGFCEKSVHTLLDDVNAA
ncbi:Maf-like protein [Lotmaria passim]